MGRQNLDPMVPSSLILRLLIADAGMHLCVGAVLIGRDNGPEHHWTVPLTLAAPCASCAG